MRYFAGNEQNIKVLKYKMNLRKNIESFQKELEDSGVTLVAVSKTKPVSLLQEAYDNGVRVFGENKVQELVEKQPALPQDIQWHMIGHLQRNKVKYIAPFVSLIHSVDSLKLLREINKQAVKNGRTIDCLLQVHIAEEEHKFGFKIDEISALFEDPSFAELENVKVSGLMGMATFTDDEQKLRREFQSLKQLFDHLKTLSTPGNVELEILSMGMSGDYKLAIEEGSSMIRVGSLIFGARNTH